MPIASSARASVLGYSISGPLVPFIPIVIVPPLAMRVIPAVTSGTWTLVGWAVSPIVTQINIVKPIVSMSVVTAIELIPEPIIMEVV